MAFLQQPAHMHACMHTYIQHTAKAYLQQPSCGYYLLCSRTWKGTVTCLSFITHILLHVCMYVYTRTHMFRFKISACMDDLTCNTNTYFHTHTHTHMHTPRPSHQVCCYIASLAREDHAHIRMHTHTHADTHIQSGYHLEYVATSPH
jgi:hypothetical protein